MPYLPILARGDDWVVVGKPSGLVVHHSATHRHEAHAALQLVRDQLGARVHPVHRLDRGTSGCLLFALDPERVAPLAEALRAGRKRYVALVRGHVRTRDPVVVTHPMTDTRGYVQDARTRCVPIVGSADPRCSLVEAWPETGRFHQVRRHLRDLSHPVLGDSTHGDTRENRTWREKWGLGRLALHCLSLELDLADGPRRAVCPLPPDLGGVLKRLPWWDQAVAAVADLSLPWPEAE